MPLAGPKRVRTSRAMAMRVTPSPLHEAWNHLRERTVVLKLALSLATIIGIIGVTRAWQLPFPYRLDQRPRDGITAVISFQRISRQQSERARDRAAEQVPFMFRQDPAPLARLPQELSASLQQVASAESLAQLSPETRTAFGLNPSPAATGQLPLKETDRTAAFQTLKQATSDERTLKEVVGAFAEFIRPLEERGLVRPEHFPTELRSVSDRAAIVGRAETFSLTDVQLPQLLAPAGLLHQRWDDFPVLVPLRRELEHWLAVKTPETLQYDDQATQEARLAARQNQPDVHDVYNRGDVLVPPGEPIDDLKLQVLQAEQDQIDQKQTITQIVMRVVTVFCLLVILAILNGYYIVRNAPQLGRSTRRLAVYLGVWLLALAASRALSFDPWRAEVGPILATVMVFAIAYNQVLATITAFSLALIHALSTGTQLDQFVVLMGACATSAILLPRVSSRSTLVIVGLFSAAAYFLTSWGTAVVSNGVVILGDATTASIWTDSTRWMQSLRGAGWCLAAGFLISGSLPFIEAVFGIVTDISLLELGDVSHPVLQELVRRAPGTYNHSITVATLGETAADSIGANGLLVRVGAYFHDIGKMLKPHYFVENTMLGAENRHEHLAPAMSTLIIIGHVRDGIDIAEQHNLPRPLIDFIEQHHGTTLVEYFYHEAARLADRQPDHRTDAEESHFRYPGPKPQSREAAVLMLADAVEGASRALSEPTPKRIERLVHDIAMKRLLDGQFNECGLTLTELSVVEESLTKSLIAMYHARIKYPEQRSA